MKKSIETIYIIIESNSYDGLEEPFGDMFFLSEDEAEKKAKELNIKSGSRRDYFNVYELTINKSNK